MLLSTRYIKDSSLRQKHPFVHFSSRDLRFNLWKTCVWYTATKPNNILHCFCVLFLRKVKVTKCNVWGGCFDVDEQIKIVYPSLTLVNALTPTTYGVTLCIEYNLLLVIVHSFNTLYSSYALKLCIYIIRC